MNIYRVTDRSFHSKFSVNCFVCQKIINMSEFNSNLEIPFQTVKRKKGRSKFISNFRNLELSQPLTEVEKSKAIRRINQAKQEISNSNFFKGIHVALEKGLKILEKNSVTEIICLGLGKVGESLTPKYQLAVLLCLSDILKIDIKVFDPVFTDDDRSLLAKFNVTVLSDNIEGKYLASLETTIFFLPHCPKQLSNNILWRNWGLNLYNCILICNSFNRIIEHNTSSNLLKGANYILKIVSHTEEIEIENSFKFDDIFNDTSLHVFPLKKLTALPSNFWEICSEPEYSEEDIEFVRRK